MPKGNFSSLSVRRETYERLQRAYEKATREEAEFTRPSLSRWMVALARRYLEAGGE